MLKLRGLQVEKQMDRNDTHAGMGDHVTFNNEEKHLFNDYFLIKVVAN